MTRRGLVLGAGGTVGGAWIVGALTRLDWDPRHADVIVGTSTGSTLAAMIGAGVGVDELVAAHRGDAAARPSVRQFLSQPPSGLPKIRSPRPAAPRAVLRNRAQPFAALAAAVPAGCRDWPEIDSLAADLSTDGWLPHPATWIVAYDLDAARLACFGKPGGSKAALRQALRASWGVPGWFPYEVIDGHRFADGAVASSESADVLADTDIDEVVVVAPMTGPASPVQYRPLAAALDRQIAVLERAGKTVIRIHPSSGDIAAMGANPMNPRRRLIALERGIGTNP